MEPTSVIYPVTDKAAEYSRNAVVVVDEKFDHESARTNIKLINLMIRDLN